MGPDLNLSSASYHFEDIPVLDRILIGLRQAQALNASQEIFDLVFQHLQTGNIELALETIAFYVHSNSSLSLIFGSEHPIDREVLPSCTTVNNLDQGDPSLLISSEDELIEMAPDEVQGFYNFYLAVNGGTSIDHRQFARAFWETNIDVTPESAASVYADFEANILFAYQRMRLDSLLYPEITNEADRICEALYLKADRVILWSSGDMDATQFQGRKIKSSGVLACFERSISRAVDEHDARRGNLAEFLNTRTGVIIADDKIAKARAYFEQKKAAGQSHIRILCIEDTSRNLDALRRCAVDVFNGCVDFIGLYAAYSRKRGAGALPLGFDEILNRPEDLAPAIERWAGLSEVFIDFDGVLSDNSRSRDWYAKLFKMALIKAQDSLGLASS